MTLFSAFVGVASHVFVDSFTHAGRFGSNLLGLNDSLFEMPVIGVITTARLFQYFGHTFGSLVGIVLFVQLVSRRHLGEWYGQEQILAARDAPVRPHARERLVAIALVGLLAGAVWGIFIDGMNPVFHMGLTFVVALLLAGIANQDRTTSGAPIQGADPELDRDRLTTLR